MPSIDPWIVEHEIKTYPNVKLVRQKLREVNPRKAPAIKVETEKLLKAGFIYLVPLTEWVSNPVTVNKKEGKIRVCTNFWDLHKVCPKDNYPTPFIGQTLDKLVNAESYHLSILIGLTNSKWPGMEFWEVELHSNSMGNHTD